MTESIDRRLADYIAPAYANAPAVKARFDAAGLSPDDVTAVADLHKVPILPKDDVVKLQQADPPFGGMLGVPMSQVRHIFFSPGPIYEVDAGNDDSATRMAQAALARSGFSPGDVVLNTLSYHLVPAGLLLDRALVEMGCTVVPGGVGNGELQVKMMADLGVTGYVGTPSFLMALLTKSEEMGLAPPEVTKSLVTADPLPPSMRQVLVGKYGRSEGSAYATAELGFLALNSGGGLPMALLPEPIVQVVDPHTGQSVGAGEAGEVVVTTLDPAYPLIRLGTGDMAVNLDPAPGESSQNQRAIILVGRSGEAVKVRGMFVHPNQLRFAVGQFAPIQAIQGIVTRPEPGRDHFAVRVALVDASLAGPGLAEIMQDAIRQNCRVRADELTFVAADTLPPGTPGMVDERSWK